MSNKGKHLIGLRDLSMKDMEAILKHAQTFKSHVNDSSSALTTLAGKTVVLLFSEPSTRTRMSFEMAIRLLGGTPMSMSIQDSSLKKGETLYDTVKNLEAMGVHGFVVRHGSGGVPQFMASHLSVPVINAGDGYTEHPTQGLLDVMTMQEHKGTLKGKHVLILGDIAHSRVARSNIYALIKYGATVTVCGPRTLIPESIKDLGVKVAFNVDDVLPEADIVNALRVQYERQRGNAFPSVAEYKRFFGLTAERLKRAKKDVLILHPGPMNRGIEIDSDVADGPHNVILNQVTNGVAVRMAVLDTLLAGDA